jgi:predicted nucleic acid-binding protein
MVWMIDTNVSRRAARRNDPDRQVALDAIRALRSKNEILCYTTQVLVEFWNVCTRPATSRGGLGLTLQATERKTRLIEKRFHLLTKNLATHQEWRRLVSAHSVQGVQVHDAMLVAVMNVQGVRRLLTFNDADFKRYSGITVLSPADVIKAPPTSQPTN